MRFIHCSDLHLDSPLSRHLDAETAALRRNELLLGFHHLCLEAKAQDVTAILISGDLFDSPSAQQKRIRQRFLDSVAAAAPADVIYLRGNHDLGSVFAEGLELPANLRGFSPEQTCHSYGRADIYGIESLGSQRLKDLYALQPREDRWNILLLHGDWRPSSGAASAPADWDIPQVALLGKPWDYIAMGHIHSQRCFPLGDRGMACYSGCLEGRGFDECGSKGYMLLDCRQDGISARFVPHGQRQLHILELHASPQDSEDMLLHRAQTLLENIPAQDMARLICRGELPLDGALDLPFWRSRLSGHCFYLDIRDETLCAIDPDIYKEEYSLRGEFARLVMEELPEGPQRSRILQLGLRALAGQEVS